MTIDAVLDTLRDRILAAGRPGHGPAFTIPEWGDVSVAVASPTLAERIEAIKSVPEDIPDAEREARLQAVLVALCLVDPDSGDRIFTFADVDDLLNLDARPMTRLWRDCSRAAGLLPEESIAEGKDGS